MVLITHVKPNFAGKFTPKDKPVFVALSEYKEKDVMKAAGFGWDRDMTIPTFGGRGFWWTDEPAVAARLYVYCDEIAAPLVKDLAESRKESRAVDADINLPCPPGLEYMGFQRAGIAYALDRTNVLFGDEMGLGKTIQAIGVLNSMELEPTSRVLVVCPATIRLNWKRELARWLVNPLLTIGLAKGNHLPHSNITIINYDILARHQKELSAINWDALIVDECHYLKNPKAQRSKAAYGIRAQRTMFLTGTPIVNRPMELYPIIKHLDPDRWDLRDFKWRYVEGKNGGRRLEELQDILRSTIMVRRLKKDVLTELPPKRRQIVELPASSEQRAALDAELATVRTMFAGETDRDWRAVADALVGGHAGAFEELSRLRHATALVKLPSVIAHVETILEEVPKVVVFAHHLDVLAGLEEGLAKYGCVKLDGTTAMGDRQRIVDMFQNSSDVRVFIGGIIPAGVGITLTASDTVVFAELDWTPGNMKQAEDRCHRIGSEGHESILIQHVVLEDSLDTYIAQVVAEKLQTIERAMDKPTAEVKGKAEMPAPRPQLPSDRRFEPMKDADYPFLPAGLAQARAIKEALQCLAANDGDRASEVNGVGFNKLDGDIGHRLAAWDGDLTPRQAQIGLKLATKYRRQLPPELMELATAKES